MPKPVQCPDPFADKVKCLDCKHWIDKIDAQAVERLGMFLGDNEVYYCPAHRKPYSIVQYPYYGGNDGPQYFGQIRMNADGTPYKDKK